jgi:hypothetical protein
MATTTWHPYAPDQAFGQQAARDEELLDQVLARLDAESRPSPRAGNKARPDAHDPGYWPRASARLEWFAFAADVGPVTTATALDAAPLAQVWPT